MNRNLTRLPAAAFLFALATVGCGGGAPTAAAIPGAVPVKGVLLHAGKPLAYYHIGFHAEGRTSIGETGENGEFSLGTNKPGDGAPPGEYAVAITYVGKKGDSPDEGMLVFTIPGPPTVKLKPEYSDSGKSGLKATVPPGGTTDLKIEVQ